MTFRSSLPSFVLGYHGLDRSIGVSILNREIEFEHSKNSYDWLGEGVYFWENSPGRARQFAEIAKKRRNSKIKHPFVVGAVIDLGHCLDLLDQQYLDFVRLAYDTLETSLKEKGKRFPENLPFGEGDFDFRKRELDCAVIRMAHLLANQQGVVFDTVRSAFFEGKELYPGAGFQEKNHIQIAVINLKCIKGVFLPSDEDFRLLP